MSRIANRVPDQRHVAPHVCTEPRMLQGNELDVVAGGYAVQMTYEQTRITDGTSNTILFAEVVTRPPSVT